MAFLKKATAPAFLGSLALHAFAGGLVTLAFAPRAPLVAALAETTTVDVDIEPAPELSAPPPEEPGMGAVVPTATRAIRRRLASREHRDATPEVTGDPAMPPSPMAAASSEPWSFSATASPDLGIGTYWKSVATRRNALPPTVEEAPKAPPPPSPDRILRDGLAEHDRALGLGSGGPLVSAAHDAASPSLAPDVGSATFDVESDATGRVIDARVVSASGDVPAWSDVAREMVRLMSSKALRVPRDGRGMHTRLRVVAERTLPSGAAYARNAGAVAKEACVGQGDPRLAGLGRKCTSGMPTGLTQTFDLSDVGARASRVVRVELLGDAVR